VIEGLRLSARTLREQAKFLRAKGYGETADHGDTWARQFEAMADQEQARLDDEVTTPRIESVRCPKCGTDCLIRR
jgi:hypothetical protein